MLAALLLAGCSSPALAKVYIDINAPTLRQIPLAAPVLRRVSGGVDQAHFEIADTIRSDLGLTDLFEVLDPRSYLEDPQLAPVQPSANGFADWFAVGAEILVKGQVQRQGDRLEVDLWVHDVLRRESLFGRHYEAEPSAARAIAHMFANTVLEEFTGKPGPFGTRIAYVVREGDAKELALVNMDGTGVVRLTRGGSLNLSPAWSRDARYLYYTSYMLGDPDLYLLDLTTWKHWVVSRRPGIDLSGKDSPDGKDLLLSLTVDGDAEIYRMDKASRGLTRLTRNRAIDVAPSWSPDGESIAFVSDRLGNPHIFVMDRDGKDVRRLTRSGHHNGDPDWSPRGDLIAFSGQDERGTFQVYVVDAKGKQVRQLTFGSRDSLDPSWSPDGRFLALSSRRGGDSAIYLLRLGGQELHRVSPPGEAASQPAWSPTFLNP
ncbi:MAG: Tol-Pal system beta propeller repeat protein TolB [Deferrisomatales bacterium]|nr:Tol-Pal system beta propeller repeat protein TolB [Deferrisomatales bacterium]